jgi:hypothetical protein
MTQRVDPPTEITAPGNGRSALQQNWSVRKGKEMRMPLSIAGYGHAAWTKPFSAKTLIQPQDGAVDTRSGFLHCHDGMHESEDAQLTGETRSLDRRLQGLNIVQDYLKKENARVTTTPARINAEVA